jgi:hypothetical protein
MKHLYAGTNETEATEMKRVSCIDEITHKLTMRIKGNEEEKKSIISFGGILPHLYAGAFFF